MARTRPIAAASTLLALLAWAGLAFAANSTDRSFGREGVAEPPPPAGAGGIGIGIRDLASAGGGRLLAAVGDLEGRRGYFAAARFSPNGSLDTSFGSGGYTARLRIHRGGPAGAGLQLRAQAVALEKNGRILVAGRQETELGGTALLLARYRRDGTLDRSFAGRGFIAPKPASEGVDDAHLDRGGSALHDVVVQPGGRIVAVGGLNEERGAQPAGLVVAYRPNGQVDRGFGTDGRFLLSMPRHHSFTGFTAVRSLRNGKILVAGYLQGRLSVVRLTRSGRLDSTFAGGDGIAMPDAGQPRACCPFSAGLALAKGGRILLGGIAERVREEPVLLFRLRPDGRLDRSFGKRGRVVGRPRRKDLSGFIELGMARQSNGRIVVVGAAERVDSEGTISTRFTTLRYLPNGQVDRGFGSDGVEVLEPTAGGAAVTALGLADGRVVVGGGLYQLQAPPSPFRPVLARYVAAGGAR
jgi:uncharacterized delta-60 repeat protein